LCTAAGWLEENGEKGLMSLRKLGSPIQGHPTPIFPYAEAATGSLGQGLSVGIGMALEAKRSGLDYKTYVLMGDGEMAEGQVWEALQCASYQRLNNLIGFVDVNRLGQSQETIYGHDVEAYASRIRSFGWNVISIDGHDIPQIDKALVAAQTANFPTMIVAKTLKGKGVSFIENKDNWHGKALSKNDLEKALQELGPVDKSIRPDVKTPEPRQPRDLKPEVPAAIPVYKLGDKIATRKAYGEVIASLIPTHPEIFVLDAETKNSTFAEIAAQKYPAHFAEMFIAEQNMVGVAVGLARRGRSPFLSSFAAFLTRTFDQVRMAAVSQANIRCVGSHVGVSIGEDGPSQMGLEDIAMFRSIHGSTVLYPADAVATQALVSEMLKLQGVSYLRTSRPALPVIYSSDEKFPVGGSKTVKSSSKDQVTVVAAGVTLFEALQAYETLKKDGVEIRVIDCYSVKPIDRAVLEKSSRETKAIVVVEDHWSEGGIGDAVLDALAECPRVPVYKMTPREMPGSGKPEELVDAAGISARHIVAKITALLKC
jgi:transketolase